jgi:transmembrane sensor
MKNLFAKYMHAVCTPGEFEVFRQFLVRKDSNKNPGIIPRHTWEEFMSQDVEVQLNHELWQKIKCAVEEGKRKAVNRKLQVYLWGLRVAAVLVIGLILTHLIDYRRPVLTDAVGQELSVFTPFGARSSFTLPDGSKVWLNSGSTLTYGQAFGDLRLVTLEGEAYFEVIKDRDPFVVNTSLGIVQVQGTSFNVKILTDDRCFVTTLEEGLVTVVDSQDYHAVTLKPGQQSSLANGHWIVHEVETELYTSWRDGRIIFRRQYLPEVASRLERWYNVNIELDDDPRLRKIHYTGTIEMESFSEVLELLKITAPIDYTYNEKTRTITITHRKITN